jgi:hypothetical protein
MTKQCYLSILAAMLLAISSPALAQEISLQTVQADRATVEVKLGLDPNLSLFPWPTSYYDDQVDHYEHLMMTEDALSEGI